MSNKSYKKNIPPYHNKDNFTNDVTLQMKKEELSITKELIKTGDVKFHIENFVENEQFTIPINHEELVIEKMDFDSANTCETIRIPLTKEQVKFTKDKITLTDISIYKEQITDTKQIEEILKEEKLKIRTLDSPI